MGFERENVDEIWMRDVMGRRGKLGKREEGEDGGWHR